MLQIPNVASDLDNIRKNANYLKEQFENCDVKVELLELPGAPPIVYGELNVPGAERTLIIYVQHDNGQPVDPTNWKTSSPWNGQLYSAAIESRGKPIILPQKGEDIDPEWRIYGRSAGDTKHPFLRF